MMDVDYYKKHPRSQLVQPQEPPAQRRRKQDAAAPGAAALRDGVTPT